MADLPSQAVAKRPTLNPADCPPQSFNLPVFWFDPITGQYVRATTAAVAQTWATWRLRPVTDPAELRHIIESMRQSLAKPSRLTWPVVGLVWLVAFAVISLALWQEVTRN